MNSMPTWLASARTSWVSLMKPEFDEGAPEALTAQLLLVDGVHQLVLGERAALQEDRTQLLHDDSLSHSSKHQSARVGRYQRVKPRVIAVLGSQHRAQSVVHVLYRRFAPGHEPHLFGRLMQQHPLSANARTPGRFPGRGQAA